MTLEERIDRLEKQLADLLQQNNSAPRAADADSYLAVDKACFNHVNIKGNLAVDAIRIGKPSTVSLPANTPLALHVGASYIVVDGTPESDGNNHVQAYLGSDGRGIDIHFGSFNPRVTKIILFNPNLGDTDKERMMDLHLRTLYYDDKLLNISDIRLKEKIRPLTHILEKLDQIRGVYYQRKSNDTRVVATDQEEEIGVIAQEVETVFPELVSAWGKGDYKGVDYSKLSVILLEGVKELNAANDRLQYENQSLAARLSALEAHLFATGMAAAAG